MLEETSVIDEENDYQDMTSEELEAVGFKRVDIEYPDQASAFNAAWPYTDGPFATHSLAVYREEDSEQNPGERVYRLWIKKKEVV